MSFVGIGFRIWVKRTGAWTAILSWLASTTVTTSTSPRVVSDSGDDAAVVTETFARDRLRNEDGWELVTPRGDAPGVAEWIVGAGLTGGIVRLIEGELRSPPIPVAIREINPAAITLPTVPETARALLEPGIYRAAVRVRAGGTPERRHCAYAVKGPHHGIVHMRFYDAGSRVAPGSWFSRVIGEGDWQEIGFTAMAPQWARQVRVVVIAHPGCSIEIDTVTLGLDYEALATFDRGAPDIFYRPEPDRWRHLSRTLDALREGRPWRVVVLGDSIANDLYHAAFHCRVNALYPGADMQLIPSVHGNAGWHFFLDTGEDGDEDRVQAFVLDHQPELVVIAGMSNRDVADLRELAGRIRAGSQAEILAVSAAVCQAHYRDALNPPPAGTDYPVTPRTPLREAMAEAGRADAVAVFDMGRTWDTFLWNETRPLEWYTRDTSHLNPRGMAVIGRMMAGFFQPPDATGPAAPVTIVPPDGEDLRQSAAGIETETAREWDAGKPAEMPVVADVTATVERVSPLLTLDRIAPYTEAFRAVEYRVDQVFEGDMRDGAMIVVIQQTLKDREPTAAAAYAPKNRHRLRLSFWEHYPDHETWPVSDDLDRYDARLFFALDAVSME